MAEQGDDVSQLIDRIEGGDTCAGEELLPLIYSELRRLAQHRVNGVGASPSLQATALVHEAYIRLVDTSSPQNWESKGHFFAAAAEAMRRIMVERARKKGRQKHGGRFNRVDLSVSQVIDDVDPVDFEALDTVFSRFENEFPDKAQLIKLRFFAGLSETEAASALGISRATASRYWTFGRAWLFKEMGKLEA